MGVNHHRLSDFRVGCGEFPDRLLTANVAARRNRGLSRFNLRGLDKVKNVLLWFVLAHNLIRIAELAPAMIGPGWSA